MADDQTCSERLRELEHDVRHSLYVISMGLELLKESGHVPERVQEICQSLDHERRQLEKLVNELVDLARKESSQRG